MKKIISFLTSAVMTAGCIGGGLSGLTGKISFVSEPLTAEAYGESLWITSAEAAPGETVTLQVGVSCNDNFESLDAVIGWDDTSLISEAAYSTGTASVASDAGDGYCTIAAYDGSGPISDGAVAAIDFTIPADAEIGTVYTVDFSSVNCFAIYDGDDICSSVNTTAGYIEVVSGDYYEEIIQDPTEAPVQDPIEAPTEENIEESSEEYYEEPTKEELEECYATEAPMPEIKPNDYYIDNGIKYVIYYDYATVYECDNNIEEADILSEVNGISVTGIRNSAFSGCTSLGSITIPDSVTSIGSWAFKECTSLENINIPDSVTSIGIYAFSGCTSLESVTIGNGVTSIGNHAFSGCTSLASITIPDSVTSIGSSAFSGTALLENQTGIKYADTWIIDCDTDVTSAELREGTKGIADSAFEDCTSLASITIPDSVISIGSSAFSDCTSLADITIPDSVTSIGSWAFYDCTSLESITIPDGVTSIEDVAFSDCKSLESITIPDSVTSIGDYAFYNCISLASVTIGNGVTSIGDKAFCECTSLESIIIPDSVTETGSCVFYGCSKLKEVTLSNNMTSLDSGYEYFVEYYGFFEKCTSLESITIPDSVTRIGNYAFFGCKNLKSITISDSVTRIGRYAFLGTALLNKQTGTLKYADKWIIECDKNATSVEIKAETEGIAERAFDGCTSLESVYISDIAAWCNIKFSGYDSNPLYYAENLYINDEFTTEITIPDSVTSIGDYAFSGCTSLAGVTIGNGVTSIGDYAFKDCTSLESITIPDSVMSIGNGAFEDCTNLESVTIGNSVTSIGYYAFYNCTSLESITIPDSVTSIEIGAFNGCTSLKSVYISDIAAWCNIDFETMSSNPLYYAKKLYINNELTTEIIIPDSVTSIGNYAFSGCTSLEIINIPNSVTSIGEEAFYGCTSLSSITIPDSVTSIGRYAFEDCTSLESVTIGNGVTSIEWGAFCNCTSLESITIPDSVMSIGDSAFSGCTSLEGITIPDSMKSIGFRAFFGTPWLEAKQAENPLVIVNNILIDGTTCSGDVVIPDSVTSIEWGAFYNCTSLESITIENPACEIYDSKYTISDTATIYGYEGSTAQAYAENYDREFVALDDDPVTTTPVVTTAVISTNTTVTASVTTAAPVETTTNTDIFDIEENNGTIIIVNCDELVVNIVVPETIGGKEVSKVSEYAFSSENIESVQFDSPDIVITDSETTINEDAVIYGYWDSTAHDYAIKYNRKFVSLDGEPETKQGDVSGDGEVDVFDAIQVAQYTVGKKSLTAQQLLAADMNGDSAIDVFDAIIIAKMTVT